MERPTHGSLAQLKKREDDVVLSIAAILERSQGRRDPDAYVRAYQEAAHAATDRYLVLSNESQQEMIQRFRPLKGKLASRGIEIAGPGTLLARWINAVVLIGTLGLVTVACSSCRGRQRTLDAMGWRGLLRRLNPVHRRPRV